MIKPFLILQLRPEDEASDNEFEAFLKAGGLEVHDVHRIRMDKESIPDDIDLSNYSGVVIGGGPSNASDPAAKQNEAQKRFEPELYKLFDKMVEQDFPYLGACYGLGIFARYLNGEVSKERYTEPVGAVTINLSDEAKDDPLTVDLPESFRAFVGHKEACQEAPPNTVLLAGSESCPIQMIRYKQHMYACQFHPELDQYGLALRINIYRHAGYFPPEDAETLIEAAMQEDVTVPELIFKRFVARYSTPLDQ
jgi:GMP synthase (glutamine-hydrolysing)